MAREALVKQLNNDAVFRKNLDSDDRVENKRRLRSLREREEEERRREELLEQASRRHIKQTQQAREESLVHQVEQIRLAQLRDEKMRQSIRESSTELRELEKKLNYAYMNKERALQKEQKKLVAEEEKAREAILISEMNARLALEHQTALQKERETYEKSLEYHQALHDQLAEAEARRQAEFEQFLREKQMVDEVVRKIFEEDARESRHRLEKQHETKQFIEDFMREREEWRQKERDRQEGETRKIEEYARMQREREEELAKVKRSVQSERDVIYDKLAAEVERQERQKAELEQLRIELYQEEQEEAARQRDRELLEARIRKRLELIDAYREQILEKRFRAMQEKEAEEEFRQKMLAQYQHETNLALLSDARRGQKQLEHRRAVDQLVEQRRQMMKEQLEREVAEGRYEEELQRYREEVVEVERQRMLREHVGGLVGFLPKGVLRDEKDLDLFDEEFRKKFGRG
ncbi:mannosyl-oligosaccharide alpha-1,2-mannosidase [Rhizophlyctis rosea]|uniref:Meiosis-specific nuclear structural protein 1 n=1 Tax=Rhizophlyctis rosea TaxID=64517 RepID=A0AAD5SCF5_9FUNG|nr:mannosyl-oligosaccharide alpha-1,2-mannosidase [Rhizophlyctis rosea]